jgi:NTP pyrophosphatase (non-canonical NTP hydrolase)
VSTHTTLEAALTAREVEWCGDVKLSPSFLGNELAGEIGEACNVIKKLEREELGLAGSRASVQDLAEELADGIICITRIAMRYGINLQAATAAKFNATSRKLGLEARLLP